MEELRLSHYIINKLCIVSFHGDMTYGEIFEVQFPLATLTNRNLKGFVINLKEVNQIDSMGIALITALLHKLGKRQIPLVLCEVSEDIQWLFEENDLEMVDTEKDALAYFSSDLQTTTKEPAFIVS